MRKHKPKQKKTNEENIPEWKRGLRIQSFMNILQKCLNKTFGKFNKAPKI